MRKLQRKIQICGLVKVVVECQRLRGWGRDTRSPSEFCRGPLYRLKSGLKARLREQRNLPLAVGPADTRVLPWSPPRMGRLFRSVSIKQSERWANV